MAHERIAGLYEENAAAWDEQRGRDLFEKPWLDRFLAGLREQPTFLDVGCGMGEPIARYLIARGARVTGLDSSPSLIALCRERFPGQEWIVGDMRELALVRTFHGVIAWHSSFHLCPDDQRALIPRLASHVAPGGHLIFTTGEEAGVRVGEWIGEPLYHASLAPEEYRALLGGSGFELVDCRLCDPECGGASVWLSRRAAPEQQSGAGAAAIEA